MSETVVVETSDVAIEKAPSVRVINITTKDEFIKVANEYKIKVGERGNLPKRALFAAVLNDVVAGTVKLIPTSFLSPDVQNKTPREKKDKPEVSYKITYKMIVDGAPSGDDLTLDLSENEVRSYLPHVKGQVGFAFATMVLALHNADDENSVGELLLSYAVSDVERVETFASETPAETTDEAPKGEETGEDNTDADKAPETVEEIKPEVIETAPVEEVKVAAKPSRTRKAAKVSA